MLARLVRRLSACLACAVLAASAFVASAESAAGRFTVAVLRRDGVLLPFAAFDGKRWTNKWPGERATEVPITLADVPKDWWADKEAATAWTAWLVSGRSQRITVDAPVLVGVHCTPRVGLRSNYVALEPPPPPQFQPYPKDGLAVTGDVRIEPVELVQPASPEATAFATSVAPTVNEAESKRVRDWARQWTHPMDERQRAKIPLTIEILARTPGVDPGTTAYYFESVKKYPGFMQYFTRPDPTTMKPERQLDGCNYVTFAGGWFITGSNAAMTKPSVGAELTNCNREDVSYVLPLGAVRAAGRLFWIVQTSSWDAESYGIVELKQKESRSALRVMGGACPAGRRP